MTKSRGREPGLGGIAGVGSPGSGRVEICLFREAVTISPTIEVRAAGGGWAWSDHHGVLNRFPPANLLEHHPEHRFAGDAESLGVYVPLFRLVRS